MTVGALPLELARGSLHAGQAPSRGSNSGKPTLGVISGRAGPRISRWRKAKSVIARASVRDFQKNDMAKTAGLLASARVRTADVCYRKRTLRLGEALGVLYGQFRYVSHPQSGSASGYRRRYSHSHIVRPSQKWGFSLPNFRINAVRYGYHLTLRSQAPRGRPHGFSCCKHTEQNSPTALPRWRPARHDASSVPRRDESTSVFTGKKWLFQPSPLCIRRWYGGGGGGGARGEAGRVADWTRGQTAGGGSGHAERAGGAERTTTTAMPRSAKPGKTKQQPNTMLQRWWCRCPQRGF